MGKQRLFTVIGIAFALLIAVGGWGLTSALLDKQETSLLSKSGSVKIPAAIATGLLPSTETIYKALTESEIYKILTVWRLDNEELPHEPKAGQLSMEQAITTGKSGLNFFSEHEILPKNFLTFEKVTATLCENKPDASQMLSTNPYVQPDDVRPPEELDPFYSYWTVTFTADKATAILTINAATGQIWKVKADYPIANSDLNQLDDAKTTTVFMEYLKQKENELFQAMVQKKSTKIDDSTSQLTLEIYLLTK